MEREKGRERIRISCEYERESCQKSCYKRVVQISFLIRKLLFRQLEKTERWLITVQQVSMRRF